ncbi:T9SS type A sorting domain-containing protein [Rhodocaloribacter litoris]|uniref:T9SS type A sorting domain-containing protein n=1 Tax=Rhodocaloribacter litoris TaxID=2558931 RepID=UPI00141F85A5|nr:T9SS type A sorting domain-containing protein [Rhodocaloribacter litoris]QXD15185.1 T9SS type A sorting domain-containing protein [Rhodocaloribacter litoris]
MRRTFTTLFALFLLLGLAREAAAQDPVEVTVREINAIPQENIDQVLARGTDLTFDDITTYIRSPLNGQKVRFTAVVLAEPNKSGLASIGGDGVNPSRVHYFVRDTSAASLGPAGMDIQIVDGDYQTTGSLSLFKGDVVTITGDVTYFGTTLQITPETIEPLGFYTDLGLPADLLDPVTVTIGDINRNLGSGDAFQIQANWANFNSLNQQYVRIENVVVWRSPNRTDDRPNWALIDDNVIIQNDDISLRYRNDRDNYPDTFDKRETDFEAPPPGAIVTVQGFALLRSDFDPFAIGAPPAGMLKITPWADEDLVITAAPKVVIESVSGPDGVPGESPIPITVTFSSDPANIAAVNLVYETSAATGTQTVAMSSTDGGVTYTGEIPTQPDGTFVTYFVEVTDTDGAVIPSEPVQVTRVLYEGINEIADIQETIDGGPGDSPFVGLTTDMDLTVIVQSQPDLSGLIAVQDDADLNPWTGIAIQASGDLAATLKRGDEIRITNATIAESFGLTRLENITFELITAGPNAFYGYKTVTTDVLQDENIAEAHEGMLLRFDNVTITSVNPDDPAGPFGEWAFSSDGTAENAVRADDASQAISFTNNFAGEFFNVGDTHDFIQGIWWYTFGNYKLEPEDLATDVGTVVNVATEDETLPARYALHQNFPNPFNLQTTIRYELARTGRVSLEVFDLLGRRIATLVNGEQPAGSFTVTFDARDLASGMYVYRLTAGSQVMTRTMLLMK